MLSARVASGKILSGLDPRTVPGLIQTLVATVAPLILRLALLVLDADCFGFLTP